ncbi:MAG: response regulator [Candidatus Eremiobacteraeota bacterium]|nr:response regulator [Candidatus Eremiobacteraeota bacterium]MBC5827219.1 response regulator [Candidatus Eremiobacteraeota bacterium]
MQYSQQERTELEGIFRTECDENLSSLGGLLLALEKEPASTAPLHETFRLVHSIKGAARMVGFQGIEQISHALETMLARAREGSHPLGQADLNTLFAGVDSIAGLMRTSAGRSLNEPEVVSALAQMGADPQASPPRQGSPPFPAASEDSGEIALRDDAPKAAAVSAKMVRVSAEKIERLMALRGELVRLVGEEGGALQELASLSDRPLEELDRLRFVDGDAGRAIKSALAALRQRRELVGSNVARLIETNVKRLGALDDLRDGLADLRMLPARSILQSMPRIVRDVAMTQGKQAEMAVLGENIAIDKAVLEALKEPLMHLVRNAVAHGIERPERRLARGKPAAGTVTIKLSTGPAAAYIAVSDDGEGIDLETLRRSAVANGHASAAEIASMGDAQLLQIIFRPGFSTTERADVISGRGVGLDVVAERAASLGGSCAVESTPGRGTSFILRVPISLLTSSVLVVRAGRAEACIQQNAMREAVSLEVDQVALIEGRVTATVRQQVMPVVTLASLAGDDARLDFSQGGKMPAIIMHSHERRVLLAVDELVGVVDVIMKPLPHPLGTLRGIAGYAILRDGMPICVLDGEHIVQAAHDRQLPSFLIQAAQTAPRRLLVADDSLTTRTLLGNIMRSAGYDVTTAIDGVDAWSKVQAGKFDCVMTDIEMPNMNGWDLCKRLKRDDRFSRMPVVLITSLSRDDERLRGLTLGADAYIVKGSFNETVLLETVERLVA